MSRLLIFPALAVLLSSCSVLTPEPRSADGWHLVSRSPEMAISGMAPAGDSLIVVHDNKKPGQPRLGRVSMVNDLPVYEPIRWTGASEPIDLEAIVAVPGTRDSFITLASRGALHRVSVRDGVARARKLSPAPGGSSTSEFEGLDIWSFEGTPYLVWAGRGEDETPSRLSWARFDPQSGVTGEVQSTDLRSPSLGDKTRHVSDLRVTADGTLHVSSATDPGDKGPFTSAVWEMGRFAPGANGPEFIRNPVPQRIKSAGGHKVEAIEYRRGALWLGTDDEASGGSIRKP